MSKNLTLSL